MRKTILHLAIVFFSLGFLLSGMQTVAGYYADPSGYGFHHIQGGYLYISIAMTLLSGIIMIMILKRLDRFFW